MVNPQPNTTVHRTLDAIALGVFRRSNAQYGIITAYEKLPRSANCREHGRNLVKRYDVSSIPQTSGIYQILCIPTGKVYIGSAINIRKRWQDHASGLRAQRHHSRYLQRAWNKYGETAFEFTIIEHVSAAFLIEREQHWLDTLQSYKRNNGFNSYSIAGSPLGYTMSDESRQRISESHRGLKMPEFSIEHRSRLSEKAKLRMQDPEARAAVSRVHKGKKLSAEHSAIISAVRGDMNRTPKHIAKVVETHALDYIVMEPSGAVHSVHNLTQFCLLHNLSRSAMCAVAKGKRTHHKGWTCRYQ